MIDIQAFLDAISSASRETRKDYHLCLGDLIDGLREADPEALIGLHNPHSYRGYYSDLALEPTKAPIKVCQLMTQLNEVIDTELTGYTGGEFLMSADTPVWVSHYGTTGEALIGFNPTTLTIITKDLR